MPIRSVTPELVKYEGVVHFEGVTLSLDCYDSKGFGSDATTGWILDDIFFTFRFMDRIDQIVVLAKLERENVEAVAGVLTILQQMKKCGAKSQNIRVYLTHADIYNQRIQNEFFERYSKRDIDSV